MIHVTEKNQWTQVFQGKYFLHIDYRDSKSLAMHEALSDANQVLSDIINFPYSTRDEISDDFKFPSNFLSDKNADNMLYFLHAIENNCLKLSEILKNVQTFSVDEVQFDSLAQYALDQEFKNYVDNSLENAIDLARRQQKNFQVFNDPSQREKADDIDPEDADNLSSVIDSYRIAGYSNAVDEVLKIAQQAQFSAQSAQKTIDQLQKQITQTQGNVKKLTREARTAKEKANSALGKIEDTADEAKSLIPNMLTILGIFVAIVIAVVACYLSVLINAHSGNSESISLVTCLLMGHILGNIIFLLLYFISKNLYS